MRFVLIVLSVSVGAATVVGCDPTPLGNGSASRDGGQALSASHDGLPCDVANLMQARCDSCHGSTNPKASLSLVTYAQLTAPAPSGGSQTVAELCLKRMKDPANPMPPGGVLAASEVATMENWVAAGTPKGFCAVPTTDDAPGCTSGKTDTSGREGPNMEPGRACIGCHASEGEGPRFTLAGTVYPTLHEPDQCVSQVTAAQVIVVDAAGKKVTMDVSPASGNFSSFEPVTFPITAEVVDSAGSIRAMATGVTSGDCNACHTQSGDQGAPGRVRMP